MGRSRADLPLAVLLQDLQLARAALQRARGSARAEVVLRHQEQFVGALAVYIEVLEALRLPVPYLLRDELRIYGDALKATESGRRARYP